MSEVISKHDVPWYGRPAIWAFALISLVALFVVGILIVPRARPGVVELVIGIAWVYPFSRKLVGAWIGYLEDAALHAKEKPSILPAWSGSEFGRLQAAGAIPLLGMLFVAVSAYVFWHIRPSLASPWARYGNMEPDFPVPIQSMATSVFVYLIAYSSWLCFAVLNWFRRLPDDNH